MHFSSFVCNLVIYFHWSLSASSFLCSYSNIFVTSPSPDNLHTMFEFIFKGFDALQYQVDHALIFTMRIINASWCEDVKLVSF